MGIKAPRQVSTSLLDKRGNAATFYSDPLNRAFATQSLVMALTSIAFDLLGNRVSVKDPIGRLNYYFDQIHRFTAGVSLLQSAVRDIP